MEHYLSNLTGKSYNLDTRILPYVNGDTGIVDRGYVQIEGLINNVPVMLDSPVSSEFRYSMIAQYTMIRHLEYFLEGSHHITHYSNFPDIVQALSNPVQ